MLKAILGHSRRTPDKEKDPMRRHIGGRITFLVALLVVSMNLTNGGISSAVAAPKGSPGGQTTSPTSS